MRSRAAPPTGEEGHIAKPDVKRTTKSVTKPTKSKVKADKQKTSRLDYSGHCLGSSAADIRIAGRTMVMAIAALLRFTRTRSLM